MTRTLFHIKDVNRWLEMVNMNKAENGRDLQEEIWVILPPQTASSASYCGCEPPSTAGRERPTVVSRITFIWRGTVNIVVTEGLGWKGQYWSSLPYQNALCIGIKIRGGRKMNYEKCAKSRKDNPKFWMLDKV